MNIRPRLCLSMIFILIVTASIPGFAYTSAPELRFGEPVSIASTQPADNRADTLFLFPSAGPGAWGQPGTSPRGFNFDGRVGYHGVPEPAGWTIYDATAQSGDWWHIESTALCAGHATDMSGATPFGGGPNNFALWCGRTNVCGWEIPDGYGNNWDQHLVLACGRWTSSVRVQFQFRTDFEGDDNDWFEVMLVVDGEYQTLTTYTDGGPTTLQSADITVLAADYPGQTVSNLCLRFTSDGGWSSDDGLWPNDMGPVWVDNIILTVDGGETRRCDFEDNIQPDWLEFTSAYDAGAWGALYSNLYSEDICTINTTYTWAFVDVESINPMYPIPVVIDGPPYIDTGIESPVLDSMHSLGDPTGQPLHFEEWESIQLHYWEYFDMTLNSLIFSYWQIAAVTEQTPCLGDWVDQDTMTYPETDIGWHSRVKNISSELRESAEGGTITGLAVRIGVKDLCGVWGNIYGDCSGHSPAPYYDNISVQLVQESSVIWDIDRHCRLQDNFPEPGNGLVRIDCADDIANPDDPFHVIGDSTVIHLNMEGNGGIQTHFNVAAGEDRPNLYMYFRVIAGPHADSTDPAMGDPDDSDGLYSPYTGTVSVYGETWNSIVADPVGIDEGRWGFDLNDEFFEPGDVIEYLYFAEAVDGTTDARPLWAMSSNPDLRGGFLVRCLPTAGMERLFVEDAAVGPWWREGFKYSGIVNYDTYTTQAPSSRLANGLAGRATADDLTQYTLIVWDSGDLSSGTITSADLGDKVHDDELLETWLNGQTHDTSLWIMGGELAADLTNDTPFLNNVMGVEVISTHLYYGDYTRVLAPRVIATHPALEWLGGEPGFVLDGSCPTIEHFSAIRPIGDLTEVTHEWEVVNSGLVAGVLNLDPDGNGLVSSAGGYVNRILYNPFSYEHVLDDGYGLPADRDYARLMIRHVLMGLLNHVPDTESGLGDDRPVAVTKLHGNYPNPFNPTTTISFSLAEAGQVELAVYDITGRLVTELVNGKMAADNHEVIWSGMDVRGNRVASGVYFYKLTADDYTATEKMIMLK
ncbi:MAG: T9SS type A sorting domain-containing protein [bacterium]|nr:T9SS type A sorting domain-containing protein [bacterium]